MSVLELTAEGKQMIGNSDTGLALSAFAIPRTMESAQRWLLEQSMQSGGNDEAAKHSERISRTWPNYVLIAKTNGWLIARD